jgi:PPM family protein phosphatase
MDLKGRAYCHKGLVRSTNEDHLLINHQIINDGMFNFDVKDGESSIFAVADGLGGHNAGEVASRMILENLKQWFEQMNHSVKFEEFAENIGEWASQVNTEIKEEGQIQQNLRGMGTTLAGVFSGMKGIYTFSAGDSRIYLFYQGNLRRITTDHTVKSQGATRMHILTNCFGASISTFMDIADLTEYANSGSIILICSDGLTDMVGDAELEECLAGGNYDCMMKKALLNGGKDNISYIILEVV